MLGHGVRVAARHLADNHATPRAFVYINMVVPRRPRGDQFECRMCIEERRIDSGGKVNTQNFRIGLDLSYFSEKPQIVFAERGLAAVMPPACTLPPPAPFGEENSRRPELCRVCPR
jgi:hypothetical protein